MNIYQSGRGKQPFGVWTALLVALLITTSCHVEPPGPPPEGSYAWDSYTHPTLGYRVAYPDVFDLADGRGDDVVFTYLGRPTFRVLYATEEEAGQRGLWGGQAPVETVAVGGREGHRYVYDHWDGPSYVHTVVYVVPLRGKALGVEFRTDADTVDDVQRRVLDSITFLP